MKLKIGIIQLRSERGEVSENLKRVEGHLLGCAKEGTEIICLPELFNTGYFWDPQIHDVIRESFDKTISWLKKKALQNNITIIAGVGEVRGERYYDSAVVVSNKGQFIYRKTHLFGDEVKYFHKGDELLALEFKGIKIGILICVEVGFPELARLLALEGVQIIFIPLAFGVARGHIYEVATRARAIENNCFIVTSNQVGKSKTGGDEHEFYGHSRIVSPWGEVILDLGEDEGHGTEVIDLAQVDACRRGKIEAAYPYLRERRPKLYKKLSE
jgi:predicted amidohydrolase